MSVDSFRTRILKLVPILAKYQVPLHVPARAKVINELKMRRALLSVEVVQQNLMGCFACKAGDLGMAIVIDQYWDRILNDDEVKAVTLHELGHVCMGHLINPLSDPEGSCKQEMEADAFAVSLGANPKALMSAMLKICEGGGRRAVKNGFSDHSWGTEAKMLLLADRARVINHPEVTKRFKALSSM
jgi:Zn-dependent protease with chaperone function